MKKGGKKKSKNDLFLTHTMIHETFGTHEGALASVTWCYREKRRGSGKVREEQREMPMFMRCAAKN